MEVTLSEMPAGQQQQQAPAASAASPVGPSLRAIQTSLADEEARTARETQQAQVRNNWYRRMQQEGPTRAPSGTLLVESIKAPKREMDVPADLVRRVAALGNQTVERLPMSQVPRLTKTWCECLDGDGQRQPFVVLVGQGQSQTTPHQHPAAREQVQGN